MIFFQTSLFSKLPPTQFTPFHSPPSPLLSLSFPFPPFPYLSNSPPPPLPRNSSLWLNGGRPACVPNGRDQRTSIYGLL